MIYAYIRNLLSFAFLTLVLSGQNALVLSKPQVVSLVSSASDPSMKNLEKITEGTNAEELRQILRVLFPSIKAVIGKREEVCKKWLITYKVFWLQFIKVSEAFHKAGTRAGNQDENEYAEEKRLCLELKLRALLYTDKIQENLVTRTKATYELEPVPIDQLEAGLKTARYRLPESPKRKLSTAFFEFTNAMRAFAILFETFSKLQVIPIATRNLTDTTKPPLDPMVQEAKNLPKRVVVDSLNTNALIQLRVHHCVEWAMETKVLHESDPCEKILKRIEGGKSKDVVEAVMELFPSASAKRIGEIIVHFEFYAFYWLVFYTNRLYLDNPIDQPYPYEDYNSILDRKRQLLYFKLRALKFTEEIKKALSEPACEPNSFDVIQLKLDNEQSNEAAFLFIQNDKSGTVPYPVREGGSTLLSMLCLK